MLIANRWIKSFNCQDKKIVNLKNNRSWKSWLEALRKRRKNQTFIKIVKWQTPWDLKSLIRVEKIIRTCISSRIIIKWII